MLYTEKLQLRLLVASKKLSINGLIKIKKEIENHENENHSFLFRQKETLDTQRKVREIH